MTIGSATRVAPDFGAVDGSDALGQIVGALLTYGLLVAVLMLVICGSAWAVASAQGSWQAAVRAKAGVMVSIAGAVLIGGSLAWANWLLDLGATL